MLYESLSQPFVILVLLAIGLASGLIFDLANFLVYFCNKNKVVKQILSFFAVIASAIILYFTNLSVNYGRFRVFVFLIFLLAFALERIFLGNLWTKCLDKCYNKIKAFKTRLKRANGEKK